MPTKQQLVEDLNREVEELARLYKESGKSLTVFLQQSINMHADELTLARIIDDIKAERGREAAKK